MSVENENELEFTEAESSEEQVTEEQPQEEEVELPSEPEEYQPNYSYKVKDEEFEFDEVLRGAISNREAEEKLRELYTKSAGLESYKGRYNELKSQTDALVSGYQTLKDLRDSGNMRELLHALNVSEEQLLQYVDSLLDEHEMPEEQRKILNENRELNARLKQLESQVSNYTAEQGNQRVQEEIKELETLITSETHKPVALAMKSVGMNMHDEVLKEGYMQFAQTGKEPTVASVVEAVSKKYSYLVNKQKEQQAAKPTLPSVKGSNASAIGSKVKSLDDLRKLASSM